MAATADNQTTDKIDAIVGEIIDKLDLNEIEKIFIDLKITSEVNIVELIKNMLTAKDPLSLAQIRGDLANVAKTQLLDLSHVLFTILAIIAVIAVIMSTRDTKFCGEVSEISIFICNLVIVVLVMQEFVALYSLAKNTVLGFRNIIEAVFPVILTLMTASDCAATVSAFNPIVGSLCVGLTNIYVNVLLPIVVFIAVFVCINSFSGVIKLGKMCDLLKSTFKWIVGITSVVFCFYVTVKGLNSSLYDTVSLKAIKYTLGNSIPLANSLLANGFDIVVASCLLIKNAIGGLGMILILSSTIMPLIKLVFASLIFKLATALGESLADQSTINLVSGTGDAIGLLAVAQCSIGIMYLIVMLLIMCSIGVVI